MAFWSWGTPAVTSDAFLLYGRVLLWFDCVLWSFSFLISGTYYFLKFLQFLKEFDVVKVILIVLFLQYASIYWWRWRHQHIWPKISGGILDSSLYQGLHYGFNEIFGHELTNRFMRFFHCYSGQIWSTCTRTDAVVCIMLVFPVVCLSCILA